MSIRKEQFTKEIRSTQKGKEILGDMNDSFEDFNPLDMLPEVIDKDYGFFLMFGKPDYPKENTASNNLDSERTLSVKI